MGREQNTYLIAIVIVALMCGYIFAPIPDKPLGEWIGQTFKLQKGIDLDGGVEVVYRAYNLDKGEKIGDKAITQAIADKIQKRINRRGLKEPQINVRGEDQIQIQLAGIDPKEWKKYKGIIERMGHLELKRVADDKEHDQMKRNGWPSDHPTLQVLNDTSEAAGPDGKLVVYRKPITSGEDVVSSNVESRVGTAAGRLDRSWAVTFVLKNPGRKAFYEATKALAESEGRIAIILDGKVESAPVVRGAIDERGEITGSFTHEAALDLMVVLETGGLTHPIGRLNEEVDPAKFEPGMSEYESLVGPSLGQDAIRRGLTAVIAAFALVALFMIFYYRAGGFVAVITLVLNLLFLMTLLAGLGATLTLPGIAGIVLTVGMAVDANVLILERIREELSKNKTAGQAFEHGYERATTSIVDANITTLIAAAVLFFVGVGTVKGFAITLALGIMTTLLSVLFCGRVITKVLVSRGLIKKFRMMKILSEPKFGFVARMRPVFFASVALIAFSIIAMVVDLKEAFGFDFRGGSMVSFRVDNTSDIKDVRNIVGSILDADGKPKYGDAQVQLMADPDKAELTEVIDLQISKADQFQVRTRHLDKDELKNDLAAAIGRWHAEHGGKSDDVSMSPGPFGTLEPAAAKESDIYDRKVGGGFVAFVRKTDGFSFDTVSAAIKEAAPVTVDTIDNKRKYVKVLPGGSEGDFERIQVLLTGRNLKAQATLVDDYREAIRETGSGFELAPDPFIAHSTMGPSAAKELRDKTFWAMVISWILMIGYIWIRFYSAKFGAAAVLALIHDAILTLGIILVFHMIIPSTWGLSFEVNLAMLAGLLTIVGYSINDTIVTFDRIRENIFLMKRASFADIINVSVNQTLSRTIITTITTWIAALVLYAATMTSTGGVSGLALPLLIGLVIGSYSSIFIASAVLLWWYKGKRPQFEKTA